MGGASDDLTSSLLFIKPIFNCCDGLVEGSRAAGVEASCDVCGIFVGESAARASVFVFLAMKESIRFAAEVGDLFRDKDPAHFRKGLHNTLHTLPIYQVKVMGMGDVSLIEELSSHLFSPIMGELPLSRSSKLFHTDEFSHLLKWE